MPGGETSEKYAADQGGAKSEEQDGDIEVRIRFVGDAELVPGHEAHDAAEQRYGKQHA
jgi:hypothetical protein